MDASLVLLPESQGEYGLDKSIQSIPGKKKNLKRKITLSKRCKISKENGYKNS